MVDWVVRGLLNDAISTSGLYSIKC